jgi:negative regulator of sigma E activity
MRNCIDEGTLQAWFDGELAANEAAQVATHVGACAECAAAASAMESDNLILSEALASEFAANVPTERLRERVNLAIRALPLSSTAKTSLWNSFAELFSFRPFAYASAAAMIVLVAIIGFVYLKNQKTTSIANNSPSPAVRPETPKESPQLTKDLSPEPQAPKLTYVAGVRTPKRVNPKKVVEPDATPSLAWQQRQYENAIAKLDDALKTQPPMRPALQVDYEYNMAVIDSAIKTTRDAAKKNPKDPLANQFMLAAYQSKVDFMNQIADARGLEK